MEKKKICQEQYERQEDNFESYSRKEEEILSFNENWLSKAENVPGSDVTRPKFENLTYRTVYTKMIPFLLSSGVYKPKFNEPIIPSETTQAFSDKALLFMTYKHSHRSEKPTFHPAQGSRCHLTV